MSTQDRLKHAVSRLLGRAIVPPGAHVGTNVFIGRHAELDWSHGRHIRIDDDVTIVSGARIVCHDASAHRRVGVTRVAPVHLCRGAFVGANAVVLPGVTVGSDAIVGAGAVVTRDVPAGVVVAGNPARTIGSAADLVTRRLAAASQRRVFPESRYNASSLPDELGGQLDDAAQEGEYFLVTDDALRRLRRTGSPG